MAASQGTSAVVTFGGVDPRSGERYVSYESRPCENVRKPRKRRIVFSIAFFG
jgi:hypothetical protein